jgi:RNA polymerase sigma-70 factor (ECF subfamily)
METTPVSLLQRLREPGDAAAWDRFVTFCTPLVFSWACRMGLQEQDAADLVQEVFTTLLRKMPGFDYDRKKSFRAWLRTVTLNHWRDMCRRKKSALRGGNDAGLDEAAVPDSAAAVWEAEYNQRLVGRALRVMQNEFQPSTWQTCWGLLVEEKSADEVAAEQGLSLDAVYAAKYRVLRRLRQELDGMLD